MSKYPLRTKIVLDTKSIEQMSHFHYLGYDITYDADHKLAKFQSICNTVCRVLSRETRKETRLKFYKVIAVPELFYGFKCGFL